MFLTVVFALSITVLAVQLIYLCVFIVAFMKENRQNVTNTIPSVSVIVCAHDEEDNLRRLIPILLSQHHPNFEVIIVDDRSNDGTHDLLLRMTSENPALRMVRVRDLPKHLTGKKFALSLGIKAAKNEWILLTDADCTPGPKWLQGMSQHFGRDKNIVLGFSTYEKHPGVLNSFIRFETFLTAIQYFGFALTGRPYMGVGRNLAYTRELFIGSKGFNDHLGVLGGDDDLFVNQHATAASTAIAMGGNVVVHSVPKKTWKEYFYQKLRHLSVGKRYKLGDRFLLGVFTLTWILWPFTLLALPFLGVQSAIVGGMILLRWICLGFVFTRAQRSLGEPFETWKVPFLDFIYGFYYLVAGPIALASKRVRWKI